MLDEPLQTNRNILIMGDINVNNLQENDDNAKLEGFLSCFNISRLKIPPTRITPQSATSIDWICTNVEPKNVKSIVTLSGLSDHTAQFVFLNLSTKGLITVSEKRRNFSKRSIEHLKSNLEIQNWDTVYLAEDVNLAYDNFHNIIQINLNNACPFTSSKPRNRRKRQYWDDESSRLKRAYTKALEKELQYGREEDKRETAERKKDYDIKLKNLRKQQIAAQINRADNKSKAFWQIINLERKATTNSNKEIQIQVNGTNIQEPVEVANHFNNFFAHIAEKTLKDNINQNQNPVFTPPFNHSPNNLQFYSITTKEVQKAIDNLKPKSSSGIDDVSAKLIKTCKEELLPPLTNIINKSLKQGIFPNKLKIAKVYPKYKKGNTAETNSYRPISLISSFSKIIEKIVLEQLLNHLHKNSLLTSKQHGFLKGRSTTTALIQLVEHIIDQLEEGCTATSLFLDFSKAFDCLDHAGLLGKMRSLGIVGTPEKWFHSYLSDRKQLVELQCNSNTGRKIQRVQSDLIGVHRGVPQGSVLGPVLFLLLTNDLPNYLQDKCQTVMYADDTVITLAGKTKDILTTNAQEAYHMTKTYCFSNNLVLNEEKTVQIVFNTRNRHVDATLPGLDSRSNTKHLGIIIDSGLVWKPHLDHLCKKISSGIYAIRRLKQVSSLEVAKTAYFALLESHIRYGIVLWGGSTATNLERVLIQQKRALRCLAGLGYRESCRTAFVEHKILTVVALYIQEAVLHTVSTAQPRHRDLHDYNTRNASNFVMPPHHLSLFGKKPTYSGAKLFNILPDDIKKVDQKLFKKRLNKWLLERPFYSLKEYMAREI